MGRRRTIGSSLMALDDVATMRPLTYREPAAGHAAASELLDAHAAPYYIVAPDYVANSAGIRVLYLLARALIRRGASAYMVDIGMGGPGGQAFQGSDVHVPVLTPALAEYHREAGLTPVVVYPETVHGNPLNAKCVVRYLLAYPGSLGGPDEFADDEMLWAYSKALGRASGTGNVLCMPVSDPRLWQASTAPRDLKLAYAPKYRMFGGCPELPDGVIEISRTWPSGKALQTMLQRAQVLYLYENSALGIEAMLSGCPVVWMQNEHLRQPILHDELGSDGFAYSNTPAAIREATQRIEAGRLRYAGLFDAFWGQLDLFITATQAAVTRFSPEPLNIPAIRYPEGTGMGPFGSEDLRRQVDTYASLLQDYNNSKTWRYTEVLRRSARMIRSRRERSEPL